MGYDLHITRAKHWEDNQDCKITSQEWLTIVEDDPELVPDPNYGSYAVLWKGLSGAETPWFDWYDGNIYTTNPDRSVLAKMIQIALNLDAKVQGDNGELYENETDLSSLETDQ